MFRYKYNSNYHHKSRRAKRTTTFALLVVVLVIGAGVYVGLDVFFQSLRKKSSETKSNFSSVQGDSVSIVRTPYFQFQLPSKWQEIASESKDGKYLYRSFNHDLIEEELSVEINRKIPILLYNNYTSHVLPVTFDKSGIFNIVSRLKDPCQAVYPTLPGQTTKPDDPRMVKQYDVSFACNPGSGFYQVVVGLAGATEDMTVTRQDGTKIKFNITYRNVTVRLRADSLYDIIESFRVL